MAKSLTDPADIARCYASGQASSVPHAENCSSYKLTVISREQVEEWVRGLRAGTMQTAGAWTELDF